jgi:intraflagellar transport protein 140
MELNFHLATGDIDAAFNAIRSIDNKAVWRSLAQMCAQSRRIDLADLCFGRMEDGGSAVLLHHTRELDPNEAAAIVVVDTQLGLYEEVKKIAKENLRFDLLAGIHQSLGEWTEAMSVVSASDRIHLRMVAHQNARSLEIRGELNEAILKYEMAGTIQFELPRLAIQAGDLRLFLWLFDRPEFRGNPAPSSPLDRPILRSPQADRSGITILRKCWCAARDRSFELRRRSVGRSRPNCQTLH